MKELFIISFLLIQLLCSAQEFPYSSGDNYQFNEVKEIVKSELSTPFEMERFSVSISGNIKAKKFEKILKSENTEVSVFNTVKLVHASDTILVNHDYLIVYFINEDVTKIFLRSHSDDVIDLLGDITIFSLLGRSERDSLVNVFHIR